MGNSTKLSTEILFFPKKDVHVMNPSFCHFDLIVIAFPLRRSCMNLQTLQE